MKDLKAIIDEYKSLYKHNGTGKDYNKGDKY